MAFGREDLSSTAPLGGDIAFFDNGLGDDELDEVRGEAGSGLGSAGAVRQSSS